MRKTTKTKVSFCANTYFYECTAPLTQAGQFNWRTSKEEQEHCVSLHFQWSGINLAVHVPHSDSKTQNLPQIPCTNERVADLWVVWPLLLPRNCRHPVPTVYRGSCAPCSWNCNQWCELNVFLLRPLCDPPTSPPRSVELSCISIIRTTGCMCAALTWLYL